MIKFLHHHGIQNEISGLKKKFRMIEESFAIFERLCEVQFNPENPKQVIAPAKLHRITQNNIWISLLYQEFLIFFNSLRQ